MTALEEHLLGAVRELADRLDRAQARIERLEIMVLPERDAERRAAATAEHKARLARNTPDFNNYEVGS